MAEIRKENRRVLVIDDTVQIHDDFRKVLAGVTEEDEDLDSLATDLFGDGAGPTSRSGFEVDTALQGQEGLALVEKSIADGRPYAVAFVDMRMPPGWNGVETIQHIWKVDAQIQMVICTAYSDFSWSEVTTTLGDTGALHLLRKPFVPDQVRKLAAALAQKGARLRARG